MVSRRSISTSSNAERPLSRHRSGRRDGRQPAHCTFNLNPRAASIDTLLHGYRAGAPCRPCPSRCGDRHCRVEGCREADAEDLRRRDGLSCPGSGPASISASSSARWQSDTSRIMSASCSAATACSPGPRREGVLRDDPAHHQQGGRLAGSESHEAGLSAARAVESLDAAARTRRRAAADARNPRPHLDATNARSAISPMRRRCWSS